MPAAIKVKHRMKQGDTIFRRRDDLLAIKFYDKREVTMLSTIHEAQNGVLDKRDPQGRPAYKFKPMCIIDYCKYMGGVDLSDQNMKYYSVMRKSKNGGRNCSSIFSI